MLNVVDTFFHMLFMLYRVALAITGDLSDTEDIAQEVFLRPYVKP